MNFVTIDFSLNSPGVCVFDGSSYTFISYLKAKSGSKKEQAIQQEFSKLKGAKLIEQPDFSGQTEYSSVEFAKIRRYIKTADDILDMVAEVIDPMDECIFAFEGTSFGSKMGTNNIIDMAAGAAILKLKILEAFNVKTIETVAPSSIKKHAGKGNMNKIQLWEKFIDNTIEDKYILESETHSFCADQIGREVKKIPKPFDDLVDAYFLNHYLRSISTTQA
jgi:hypothetical protein